MIICVPQTTIKVKTGLRDRLAELARRDGLTLGELLERMLATEARRDRLEQLRLAISRTSPEELATQRAEDLRWERAAASDPGAAR